MQSRHNLNHYAVFVVCVLIGICTIVLAESTSSNDLFSIFLNPQQQRQCGLHKLNPSERKTLEKSVWQLVFKIKSRSQVTSANLENSAIEYLRGNGELKDAAVEYLENEGELESAAVEYLKDEGWDEITVTGTREINSDEYLIAEAGYYTYILEPKSYLYSLLRPGQYFGNMGFTSCEIINSDGDVVKFWTEDTE